MSGDSHETQCRFAQETQANFPMIGDHDKKISKAYGTGRAIIGLYKRVTFVIDKGGVVRGVFHHELAIDKHVDEVLAMFRTGF